nr:ATP-binding protein [Ancylobacter koreensis]
MRAKLTGFLVGGVVLVVVLATGLSFALLTPPHFEATEDAIAAQLVLLAGLIEAHPDTPPASPGRLIGASPAPAGGPLATLPMRGLNAALDRMKGGRPPVVGEVVVSNPPDGGSPVISARLPDGRWLLLPVPMPPAPPNPGWAVVGWALMLAIGTTAVMVFAVRRLTAPLALLERTAAAIGPQGEMAPLREDGPTEVRVAARAINLLSSRLKAAMESRIRMVAAAGHDLRTPMTRMRLRAEFLDEDQREAWIADLDELDHIADSAIRLVREEVQRPAQTPLRLDLLVDEVVGELDGIGLPVTLAATGPATVTARPLALKRAIRNLAINASTHGRGARVEVGTDAQGALVRIADDGPGIPPALLAQVFEPFFRVDPARGSSIPGAGLGLAIAREIVLNHGGSLTLDNLPGGGLEQRVRLPALPGSTPDPEPMSA